MKFKRLAAQLTLTGILTCTTLSASAGIIENIKQGFNDVIEMVTPYRGPKKDITNLIITSNYVKSKMLAELIQFETKQPYILLPAAGQDKIYFCPAHGKKPQEIKEEKLARFIKFVNPRQILVLGDKTYVPEKYIKMIDENQTLWVVSNRNWNQTAKSVGKLLDLGNLAPDFKRTLEDWQSGQRYIPEQQLVPLQQIRVIEEAPKAIETTTDVEVPAVVVTEEIDTTPTILEEPAILEEPQLIIPDSEPVIIEEK